MLSSIGRPREGPALPETESPYVIPTGTVVFLFTDIEGSTVRWDAYRDAMQAALRRHDAILRSAIESHDGYVFKTIGDAFCASFSTIADALAAAIDAQLRIGAEDWSSVNGLRVRMAIHAGETDERSGDYFGPVVNRVARLLSVGHGGQVLLSGYASDLAAATLPPGAALHHLGMLPLKDLKEPERVFQLSAPGLDAEFKPPRALETPPNNLPQQATSFVGRHDDLAQVDELLRTGALVTVAGTGGTGKTRLALAAAKDLLNDKHDGAWFVDLAPIADAALVASTILSTLGADQSAETAAIDVLIDYLKKSDLLIVLDNCEHVIAEVARVTAAIVANAPHVTVLATSREALNIAGERVYRLGSLDPQSATALFADRALAANPRFQMTDVNRPVILDICNRLDGIAFAIELAAARTRSLPVEELSRRLELRILGGGRERQPRQQTMTALIDWSYDALSADEKSLFRRLAVFAGGFTLDAATGVCSDETTDEFGVLDILTSLADKSLLALDIGETGARYRLLELVREYAREKLDAAGETPGTRLRHARTYAALADAGYLEWDTDPRPDWLPRLEGELDNFRAALRWSIAEGNDAALGAALAGSVAPVFMRLSLLAEGIGYCRAALDAGCTLTPCVEGRLRYALSMLYNNQCEFDAACAQAERARDLLVTAQDDRPLCRALSQVAQQYGRKSLHAEARTASDEALRIARRLGDRRLLGATLQRCASTFEPAEIQSARDYFLESLSIFRSLGRDDETARALEWWADAEIVVREYGKAIALLEEALTLGTLDLAFVLTNITGCYLALGDARNATPLVHRALALVAKTDHPIVTPFVILYVAALGDPAQATEVARLFGYVRERLRVLGWVVEGPDRVIHDNLMTVVSRWLEGTELQNLLAEGSALTAHQAVTGAFRLSMAASQSDEVSDSSSPHD
jgi:predicted ATPase/class 3 adenylate cyclase